MQKLYVLGCVAGALNTGEEDAWYRDGVMDLICASICYRGYAEDEFACTLEKAPQVGFRLMEIHGPMTWTPEAVAVLDPEAIGRQLQSAGLRCAGLSD